MDLYAVIGEAEDQDEYIFFVILFAIEKDFATVKWSFMFKRSAFQKSSCNGSRLFLLTRNLIRIIIHGHLSEPLKSWDTG